MRKHGEAVEPRDEIVAYQLDETVRLEVRLAEETVWLSQVWREGRLEGTGPLSIATSTTH